MPALPDKMMAAVLHSAGDLRYEEAPVPEPGPDDVLIEVKANGLCGSDIHFFEDGRLGPYEVTRPYIPGHEACGTVVRASRSGIGPAVGQRVAIEPGVPCRRCALCKSGRYNLCRDVVFMSEPPVNGTFAQYVALAADFAHPLPDGVGDESGAFVEPISVGIQACARADLTAAQSVAVLGAGPIGLVTLLVARAFGAADAYVVDVLPNRLGIAAELGATATVDATEADAAEAMDELTAGRGVDVVFDTSGSFNACAAAPLIAARGGIIAQVGWPDLHQVPYPVETVMEKELDVRGVNRYCNTYPRAISLLASGGLDVSPLITHRFPFARVCDAFQFASENREATLKVMVLRD
jgi:L-iditol 2-dehydrogenase